MVILMTTKKILTIIKLIVRIFIIELAIEMAVMFKMLVMREIDDEVSIILVFQGNLKTAHPICYIYIIYLFLYYLAKDIPFHILLISYFEIMNIIYITYT